MDQDHLSQNSENVVNRLIEEGANINFGKDYPHSLLQDCSLRNMTSTVQLLLDKGYDTFRETGPGRSLLFDIRNEQMVDLLCQRHLISFDEIDDKGNTLLHLEMTDRHDTARLKTLLKHIDVNAVNNRGDTALHYLFVHCHEGYNKVPEEILTRIDFLLQHGAKIHAKNNSETTPFLSAIRNKDLGQGHHVLKKLLDAGADINETDGGGYQAIHYSADWSIDDVKFLVENGAELNTACSGGTTPLMIAIQNERADVAEYLIGISAGLNHKDNAGKTALDYANQYKHYAISKLLEENNADATTSQE